ncbi:hypothetical protein [Burkholderia cepacia]|uniref:hypothetical protein n=1 Tax=Burkholderia cepacia TaxID=292 RepID=UPI000A83D575|nr:hypothetical protein [Burkholderia cepacia]
MAMRIVQTKDPVVAEDDYGDYLIHVATSYYILKDNWPFHVFIGRRGQKMLKVGDVREAGNEQEAYEQGFAIGRAAIDDLLPFP